MQNKNPVCQHLSKTKYKMYVNFQNLDPFFKIKQVILFTDSKITHNDEH